MTQSRKKAPVRGLRYETFAFQNLPTIGTSMNGIIKRCCFLAAIIPLLTSAFDSSSQTVVINEIMYHSASGMDDENFVELHNTGSQAANLDGWQFSKGIQYAFSAVAIPPGGFWVVAADANVFRAKYPEVTSVAGNWTGTIS